VADTPEPEEKQTANQTEIDRICNFTDAEWEYHEAWLYRVAPKIENMRGPAYIDIFTADFSLPAVAKRHGGGTYKLYLKNKKDKTSGLPVFFSIGGRPILDAEHKLVDPGPGQVLNPGTAAPASPFTDQVQFAKILADAINQAKEKNVSAEEAAKQAMELLSTAYKTSIETTIKQNSTGNSGGTGNPLLDQLLTAAITNFTKPAEPSAIEKMLMEAAIKNLTSPKSGNMDLAGLIENLPTLKTKVEGVFGIDLADVFRRVVGGGPGEGAAVKTDTLDKLITVVDKLAPKIPEIIGAITENQNQDFNRRLHAHNVLQNERGTVLPLPAQVQRTAVTPPPSPAPPATPAIGVLQQNDAPTNVVPINTAVNGAAPADAPPAQPAPANLQEVLLMRIVEAFRRGDGGDFAAAACTLFAPDIVESFKPLLVDEASVLAWAKSDKYLSQIAGEPDFPIFMQDFCKEALNPGSSGMEEEETDHQPVA
jgi:hypothetical protein